jgi:hypothetical protein
MLKIVLNNLSSLNQMTKNTKLHILTDKDSHIHKSRDRVAAFYVKATKKGKDSKKKSEKKDSDKNKDKGEWNKHKGGGPCTRTTTMFRCSYANAQAGLIRVSHSLTVNTITPPGAHNSRINTQKHTKINKTHPPPKTHSKHTL